MVHGKYVTFPVSNYNTDVYHIADYEKKRVLCGVRFLRRKHGRYPVAHKSPPDGMSLCTPCRIAQERSMNFGWLEKADPA